MKREAVQNERDRISKRPHVKKPVLAEDDLSMDTLQRAEKLSKEAYPEVTRDPAKAKQATRTDVSDAIKRQLLVLVEWAKCIPAFAALSIDDQVNTCNILQVTVCNCLYYNIGCASSGVLS